MLSNDLFSQAHQVDEFIYTTPIQGLLFIKAKRFDDDRGFYAELARVPELEQHVGFNFVPQQINLSHSKQYVTRGMHAENWNKLITVTQGSCFCAWADIRPTSETFGHTVTMSLGTGPDDQFGSVFVTAGIANSFCAMSEKLDYLYAVDALYATRDTRHDVAISLFDSDLAIEWPINREQMIISERDQTAITLREKFPERF